MQEKIELNKQNKKLYESINVMFIANFIHTMHKHLKSTYRCELNSCNVHFVIKKLKKKQQIRDIC